MQGERVLRIERALRSAGASFSEKYNLMKNHLLNNEYEHWAAGFPQGNNHGPGHIRRVLKNLDDLLGLKPLAKLNPYELFLAMMAILYHDIGLLRKREGHAEISKMLLEIDSGDKYIINPIDKDIIGAAVVSHSSSKDIAQECNKFQEIENIGQYTARPTVVAALVRFADELDEDFYRAPSIVQQRLDIPEESVFFWLFCQRVQGIHPNPDRKSIDLNLVLELGDINRHGPVGAGGKIRHFVAFCAEKLAKINQERVYVNHFLPPPLRYTELRLTYRVKNYEQLEQPRLFIFQDRTTAQDWLGVPDLLDKPTNDEMRRILNLMQPEHLAEAEAGLEKLASYRSDLKPHAQLKILYYQACVQSMQATQLSGGSQEREKLLHQAEKYLAEWFDLGQREGFEAVGSTAALEVRRMATDLQLSCVCSEKRTNLQKKIPESHWPPVTVLSLDSPQCVAPAGPAPLAVRWAGDFSSAGSNPITGREIDLQRLTDAANTPGVTIVALVAVAGQGKTALARAWIEELARSGCTRDFENAFAFSFYHDHKQAEFAQELVAFLDPTSPPTEESAQEPRIAKLLSGRRILLLLDGLEDIQSVRNVKHGINSNPLEKGQVAQGAVRDLLASLCTQDPGGSLVLITSRVHLMGFEEYEGTRLINIELGGLDEKKGGHLLYELGMSDTSTARREEYSRDLMGHPLMLRLFADAVRRQASTLSFGNAATIVGQAMGLAEETDLKGKFERVVLYYRDQMTSQERLIIEAVAVFGGMATDQTIRKYLRHRLTSRSPGWEATIGKQIETLAKAGILEYQEGDGPRTYTCHPILREGFRPDPEGAWSAATISLYSRPTPFKPRNLAEAQPYLEAIAFHATAGGFKQASQLLRTHLSFGDGLSEFPGGQRALLNCLLEFLRPDRRVACEHALKTEWLLAMVPRLILASIDLDEWEIADEYAKLDAELMGPNAAASNNLHLQLLAQIAAEIGAADDARSLYRKALDVTEKEQHGRLILGLADLERALGAPSEALSLIQQWLGLEQPVESWISGWPSALETLARICRRVNPALARRCAKAIGSMELKDLGYEHVAEYLLVDLKPRSECTPLEWERVLMLATRLELERKEWGIKTQGSWPLAQAVALNALRRARDAELVAARLQPQFHNDSWRRLWCQAEIARSLCLQGRLADGLKKAADTLREARLRQRYLIVRDTAELILEFGASDSELVREAHLVLDEFNSRTRLSHEDFPHLGSLPGELGWEKLVTERILRQIRPEGRDEAPKTEDLDEALVLAAGIGLLRATLHLLDMGASPQTISKQGETALVAAIKGNRQLVRETVEVLLKARTEPFDLANQPDQAAARAAIDADNDTVLNLLLRASSTTNLDFLTILLAYAAEHGGSDTIRALCVAGADHTRRHEGRHPLVRAARNGNLSAVEALVEYVGSDVDRATDDDGETALMAAAGSGHEPVIAWLMERGASVTVRDHSGKTAVTYALESNRKRAVDLLTVVTGTDVLASVEPAVLVVAASQNGNLELVKQAVARGARVDDLDGTGRTALHAAAANGQIEIIRAMRELVPDLNIEVRGFEGFTPLLTAVTRGRLESIAVLVKEFNAKLDAVDKQGRDAITLALAENSAETIQMLASLGALPRESDSTIDAIRNAAAENQRDALVTFLKAVAAAGWMGRLGQWVAL